MKKKEINSARIPIYRDSGFDLHDASVTSEIFASEPAHERDPSLFIYSRYRNPTVVAAEEAVMKVEKCRWALLTQSGMSAIDTALSVFQQGSSTKPWLFLSEIYGGTISFIESVLKKRRGVDARYLNPVDGRYNLAELETLLKELKPEFVYCETISNPLLIVADITGIIEVCKKTGTKVIVDNTFATPEIFRPLEFGADIVIHSATKYLSGHGNITAGVICGNDDSLMREMIEYRKFTGHMLSPDDAYRLTTQIKTFSLRFRQQCLNASRLAELFSNSSKISKVLYPGFKDHKSHELAVKQFGNELFGAMVTVDFAGADPVEKGRRRDRFISSVSDTVKLIPTLGDHSTILLPVEPVWGSKYREPGMVRISAGFEDFGMLGPTVTKALAEI
jgi:cystathionine beta-lyase/cystathionine gamma-synthase